MDDDEIYNPWIRLILGFAVIAGLMMGAIGILAFVVNILNWKMWAGIVAVVVAYVIGDRICALDEE